MADEWNVLMGELRSALAARDWHQAGAIVWQLRQLDGERFTLELEHYTNEQVRKGGYGMALETEQRLEAVRRWAHTMLTQDDELLANEWRQCFERLIEGKTSHDARATDPRHHEPRAFRPGLPYDPSLAFERERVRQDMADILWSILQS